MHQGKGNVAEVVGLAKATPNQIAMLLLFFAMSGVDFAFNIVMELEHAGWGRGCVSSFIIVAYCAALLH